MRRSSRPPPGRVLRIREEFAQLGLLPRCGSLGLLFQLLLDLLAGSLSLGQRRFRFIGIVPELYEEGVPDLVGWID